MIRSILILTVLAALVPTALSNVSASSAEIALFSSDADSLSITGNEDIAKMDLKATNENGKTKKVSDFRMTADNVLYIKVGDKVDVKDNVEFTKAITTDGLNNQKAIGITSDGVIDFTGYAQGVSTLDIVVDDDRAYEAIIVIGQQPPEIINKQVTKINNDQETKLVVIPPEPPCPPGQKLIDGRCGPIPCPPGQKLIDGKCVPIPIYCPAHAGGCEPCDEGFVLEGEECVPEPPIPCDEGFEREGDECVPMRDICMGLPEDECAVPQPPVETEPIECSEGEELVDGGCVLLDTNPVEPNDLVPIDDDSEGDDDSGSDDSEGSEGDDDSGGNDSDGDEGNGDSDADAEIEESAGSDSEGSEESEE